MVEATRLYRLINPSDCITFRATLDEAACMAAVFRNSMLFVHDEETDEAPSIENAAAIRDAIFASADRIAGYADAWDSLLVADRHERFLFEKAVEGMSAEQRQQFRAEYHDRRRTSLNDICSRAWQIAIDLRACEPEAA
ncbi:Hypothetical protein RG1141_CH01380 [Neorhizobium galegae bv. officinalis bv. officinalis str. HAMBI 1141]|uniref:Uncharacterized protein n=1 Tax=Neorhizobium galegae bv. officinalis bv. officinalis str. HAMBI 1141 TaxID=1028801 RepID=A0A068T288_NEOGA|nr:hypothetical protein [Neorhizobium galegae]CDN52503.1 Hypothetical protein RG1141_CH01380 [Neorhizobium galegae bv. officinalis bv. officinalis str. HAMBI 1141]